MHTHVPWSRFEFQTNQMSMMQFEVFHLFVHFFHSLRFNTKLGGKFVFTECVLNHQEQEPSPSPAPLPLPVLELMFFGEAKSSNIQCANELHQFLGIGLSDAQPMRRRQFTFRATMLMGPNWVAFTGLCTHSLCLFGCVSLSSCLCVCVRGEPSVIFQMLNI